MIGFLDFLAMEANEDAHEEHVRESSAMKMAGMMTLMMKTMNENPIF